MEEGDKIVHKLAGGNFYKEVRASILETGVGELNSQQVRPWTIRGSIGESGHTTRVDSCVLGLLAPMRRLSDRIASLGWTVFDRMISEISRFSAMSSRLLDVAFSICWSRTELADEDHQPAMMTDEAIGGTGQWDTQYM